MNYAVAVQNTETEELSLMGPYTKEVAERARDAFVFEMDAKYGLTDVYSVWVIPLRTMQTEISMFTAMFDLYRRTEPEARTLDSTELDWA